MAAKRKPLPKIEQRDVIDGYLHTYDRNGRLCLDTANRERIVLVRDLRVYGDNLHIGALGWTIPETSDGYKIVDVEFDTGQRLRLNRYAFERITPETEVSVANELLTRYKNTRFDSDPEVAQSCREKWIASNYGDYMSLGETIQYGVGDQELYAFTFPSLKEIARLKVNKHYPVKVGFSKNSSDGAYGRIRSQIVEKAAYPERPEVLCIWRTWDGRDLEAQVHKYLRNLGRAVPASLGKEWFQTSVEELLEIISKCGFAEFSEDRVVDGADETLEEAFSGLMANGATIEIGMVPGQAAVALGLRYPEQNVQRSDASERRSRGV